MTLKQKLVFRLIKLRQGVDAYWQQFRYGSHFATAATYCMFIGYPRSGHSLIGSLLDAHPDAVIAHELGALAYVGQRVSKRHLFGLLIGRSHRFATKYKSQATGYSYAVPNQWQGRFKQLKVIGDKHGDHSTHNLGHDPTLIVKLQETVKIPVKFIHIIRNPYDNITTMAQRNNVSLEIATSRYFRLCRWNADIKQHIDAAHLIDVRHEDFVANSQAGLTQLCNFLGLDAPTDYLNDCSSIVFESPKKRRHSIEWRDPLIAEVQAQIDTFNFLHGYSYES